MKNLNLFALGTALVLAFTVGCRTNPPKTTPLPGVAGPGDAVGATTRTTPDLSTTPVAPGSGVTGAGATGTSLPSDLPDPDKLAGREQDRARFSGETVYFDFDRANVKPAEAAKINKVVAAFKALPPGHDLLVEGHCDERGTEGYNQALGERRALAMRELLTATGIDGQHVFTKSLGKDHPADPGHNETAWGKNRRGEFILVLPGKITTTQNAK